MKKKKVLIIAANGLGNSGVPNVFMQIVRNLSGKYEFDLVITREDYHFKEEFLSFGGKIFLIKEKKYKSKIKKIFWRLFCLNRYTNKKMSTILRNTHYDIIHSFKESESWMYLKIAKKFHVEKRIIHNNRQKDDYKSFFASFFVNKSIKKSVKYSTNNISVSKKSGRSFFNKTKFDVIYNTYDENTFYFRESSNTQNFPLLAQIGTFLPVKNQLFSLCVLENLKNYYPNIQMIFIGKPYDLTYFTAFKNEILHKELTNNIVVYEDFGDKKQSLLDYITYFLMPSIKEGFSLVSIESQSVGIKVFASSGVPTEVDLGNVEFLELNVDLWTKRIINDFKTNRNNRKRVSMKPFSIDKFKKSIQNLYN